jgi:HlyD family secretion protein
MRSCTWMVAVAGASWIVPAAAGGEPNVPSPAPVEIRCPLPGTSMVLSIVNEGSSVKKGEVLLSLDDSEIRAELERAQIEVQTAHAETIATKASLELAGGQREELGMAEAALKVAELRRRCFSARFEFEQKAVQRQVEPAGKSLDLAKRRHEKTVASGGESNSLDLAVAELEILKAKAELETAAAEGQLLELTRPLREAERELAVRQAQGDLAKTKRTTAQRRQLAQAALLVCEQTQRLKQARLERIQDLLKQCTIRAPREGTIRYPKTPGSAIAEGALVRQRQTLLILIGKKQTSEAQD